MEEDLESIRRQLRREIHGEPLVPMPPRGDIRRGLMLQFVAPAIVFLACAAIKTVWLG